jgi:hypothetical protein
MPVIAAPLEAMAVLGKIIAQCMLRPPLTKLSLQHLYLPAFPFIISHIETRTTCPGLFVRSHSAYLSLQMLIYG